ncbi:MAG: TROVE domain-containing protein [Deltaproteobacteria bacterium]|nr:TROVE domain-containing protein [Deltaproteobacteria bacterium]
MNPHTTSHTTEPLQELNHEPICSTKAEPIMARFKSNKRAPKAKNPSPAVRNDATINLAGGEAFHVADPSLRLLSMLGSSFFNEPKAYSDASEPSVAEGDGVTVLTPESQLLIKTAREIAKSENPRDLLVLAHWARRTMNVRTSPQVLLAVAANEPETKGFVRGYAPKIVRRADEVREAFAAYLALFGSGIAAGKSKQKLPNSLKRGLADALGRFSEAQILKYDTSARPTFKDVLRMIDRRKGYGVSHAMHRYLVHDEVLDPEALPALAARKALGAKKDFDDEARALVVRGSVPWEVVLSQFGPSKNVWESIMPSLGYMALLRNLRNLLQHNVDPVAIAKRLADPVEVERSKQLPFRFYAARAALADPKLTKAQVAKVTEALATALEHSCASLKRFSGSTAIASDNSGSMSSPVSGKSMITCANAANLLAAIASRVSDEGHLYVFGQTAAKVPTAGKDSIFEVMDRQAKTNVGHSTNAHAVLKLMISTKVKVDRLILLSDMQCWDSSGGSESFAGSVNEYRAKVNPALIVHSVDLAGHGKSVMSSGDARVNLVSGFSEKILSALVDFEVGLAALPSELSTVTQSLDHSARVLPTMDALRAEY